MSDNARAWQEVSGSDSCERVDATCPEASGATGTPACAFTSAFVGSRPARKIGGEWLRGEDPVACDFPVSGLACRVASGAAVARAGTPGKIREPGFKSPDVGSSVRNVVANCPCLEAPLARGWPPAQRLCSLAETAASRPGIRAACSRIGCIMDVKLWAAANPHHQLLHCGIALHTNLAERLQSCVGLQRGCPRPPAHGVAARR